jgi:exfoliative toxin A/B
MKKYLKALPLPVCGVMLGLAALGNLLQAVLSNLLSSPVVGDALRVVCGVLAGLIWVAVVLKLIFCAQGIREVMQDPVVASVSGTFPMATMLLSVYLKPLIGAAAQMIWFAAIALHILLIVWFTVRFLLHLKLEKVFSSYFIVYVGIAVASITAPAYEQLVVGAAAFWFGFVTLLLLLVLVTARYIKVPVKEPAKPLVCIYAAPVSLCLVGYIQSITSKSTAMVIGMLVVSTLILLAVLCKLPGLLRLRFYPSYAAFTFPFVITAIAAMQSMAYLKNMGLPLPWLRYVVLVEATIAAVLVAYSCCRYFAAVIKTAKA